MRRREFLGLVGATAVEWPIAARAQPSTIPVVGLLTSRASSATPRLLAAVHQGLKDQGFVEGQNVSIEYRFAENQNDRLPAMAADLAHRKVTVIIAFPTVAALAAKMATTTIPIVFEVASDPVTMGLVASLNRPGGNITGVTNLNIEVTPKRLELLRELLPSATNIAVLLNPTNISSEPQLRALQAAAKTLGIAQLPLLYAATEREFEIAFETVTKLKSEALVIANDPFFSARSMQLAALAVRYALPAIFNSREFVRAGGLMSYGNNLADAYRQAGIYTGRILKGEKPADLPVQQAKEINLIINTKTAKALGLTIALPLLGRANELIE